MRSALPAAERDDSPRPNPQLGVAASRPGRRRASASPLRRRRFPGIALVALALLVVLGAGSFAGYTAATGLEHKVVGDLQGGEAQLLAGKTALKAAVANHDLNQIAVAKAEMASASARFEDASRQLNGVPELQSSTGLPILGPQIKSRVQAVNALSEMGRALADAGIRSADVDALLLAGDEPGKSGTAKLLSLLDQTRAPIAAIAQDIDTASRAAARVDVGVLPGSARGPLVSAKASIASAEQALSEFNRLIPVIQEVLGANGARTYLVEQVNPAELRAGGGFIGTYSILSADKGQLTVVTSGDIQKLELPRPTIGQRGYVDPPGPLKEFIPGQSWSLEDSNLFPDFASNAAAAEQFAVKDFGRPVDGVIALDFYAVAEVLKATGPLHVGSPSQSLTADNFVSTMIQADENDPTHKQMLASIAGPLMQTVSGLPSTAWPQLLSSLNSMASSRHVQAYFNNTTAQQEMDRIGWSGSLPMLAYPEFMLEVESNFGGTKANYWVTRHYSVDLNRAGGVLHHSVVVDLTNRAPTRYPSSYRCYIRLYVPADATGLKVSSVKDAKYPLTTLPPGTAVAQGWFQINVDPKTGSGALSVKFDYDTPWKGNASNSVDLYWEKQAGVTPDPVTLTFTDGGHTSSVTSDTGLDHIYHLSDGGVTVLPGHTGSAQLPSLGF